MDGTKVEFLAIDKIQPYKKNTKKHTDEQVQSVANSIKEFGWSQPIVVDKKGTIIIGHCRYEAAKKLGLSEVPAIRREDLTEKEARALRIVDNKTNESAWDVFTLAGEIKDIPEYDFTDFGFGNFEILELKELAEPETETTGSTGGSWGVPTGGGSPSTPYPKEESEAEEDYDGSGENEPPTAANEPDRKEADITERHIFIAYGEAEIQWLKDRLGITGSLLPAYSAEKLMESERNED